MTAATTTDDLDVAGVRQWLVDNETGPIGDLTTRLIAGGRSNPTYEIGDGTRQWILRRPPQGHVLPTAHDMGREYRAMSSLRDSTVPVPRTVGLCEDSSVIGASFYVMDKLDGITLRTQSDTEELTEQQRTGITDSMIDTLVALHSLDPADVGLSDWGNPDGFLERQLRRWMRQWDASATSERPEVAEIHRRLTAALPQKSFPGIVHGDFKIDNMMVDRSDPTKILGVLDWEMSTLGDTLTDLGILCSFWDQEGEFLNPITAGATALPGFPTRDEVVRRYIAARGIDVPDIDWYLVFADFKVAVILEGIHARHQQGHTEGEDFSTVGEMVGPLLGRALERASASSVPELNS
ncbi:phosphotransferase family protein [Rhodococcus sp. BP-252]|uniref:phosphotransferase family protein n=1 Tax=unclassified Rhodococcus (in: high G+C Gram-positive bacteria) TaxID=192944 RepID=UPI001C9AB1F0|nr:MULTISPECIES: phosphotransferase family protein [unclassified Rhodococcus (in: high G+C Gram-positive bacteria)]MBY6414210.1 phosphotransferase family protein [Rhodococcus sp. BP-320]MBY6418926.1 phosphotransferase family protein [Rhodococcus sp. BP-321]MBY6423679.1 phosphotransferase family protein [Rhodococcus sp. BP-324]MBY6429015.1 phosphotransferase family protein [Rhodococcus sp. BP-323]MBY6434020.1 phosphotransferase family protein [Rhodococcus sp. BP-322]